MVVGNKNYERYPLRSYVSMKNNHVVQIHHHLIAAENNVRLKTKAFLKSSITTEVCIFNFIDKYSSGLEYLSI